MSNIYADIAKRTGGDIYIGVVGPVRTGKSTLIKRVMEGLVIPNIEDLYQRERAKDELPQSGEGRTITTTEPKFIPPDAVLVSAENGVQMKVRLVDCVGYLVPGVLGDKEEGEERMVSTPWAEEQIPFSRAAELGTEKVIHDHSVVGVVVTTDGSFGELPRENFVEAEEKTIAQLKALQKPFVVILNSANPQSQKSRELAAAMEKAFSTPKAVSKRGMNWTFPRGIPWDCSSRETAASSCWICWAEVVLGSIRAVGPWGTISSKSCWHRPESRALIRTTV